MPKTVNYPLPEAGESLFNSEEKLFDDIKAQRFDASGAKVGAEFLVNTATAKELEAALDVGAGVADAIVAFRADKGAFKSLEDVMKVPGLDAAKVEAVKGRLVY